MQMTVAIVAALSLFVAPIAGLSLRPQLAAAGLPEPAAWTQSAGDVQAHVNQMRRHDAACSISHLDNAYFRYRADEQEVVPQHVDDTRTADEWGLDVDPIGLLGVAEIVCGIEVSDVGRSIIAGASQSGRIPRSQSVIRR